jgi:beta-barrel assembly-enhancing protease
MSKKIFFLLIAVLLNFAFALPVSASLTIEDEKKIGKEFYEKLEKSNSLSANIRVNAYITRLGSKIVSTMPKDPFEYHFSVVNSSAINAFATPGGYVYVNKGLINLVENESELAGVLSHEIAHAHARHIADIVEKSQKINIATLGAILAGAFLGGGGEVTAAVTGFSMAAATTLNLKYSREHEEEADRLGLSFLTKAGYAGQAMLDFLKIMRQYEYYSSNVPSYFLTHPGTDERIRYIDGLLQTKYGGRGSENIFGQLRRIQVLLSIEGKNAEANLKKFQTELVTNPKDVDYLYGTAVIQGKLGLISQSLDSFNRALKFAPNDIDILRDMGIVYFKSGRYAEAAIYLRKAVEIDEDDAEALSYFGKSLEAAGDYLSAIEAYRKVEKKNKVDDEVFYNLAIAYGRMNNMGESHYYFGIYFNKKNKTESAIFHFHEALKFIPPESPRAKEINNELNSPRLENKRSKDIGERSHPGRQRNHGN